MLVVCALIAVVDGDTVKCDGQNIRLLGDGKPNVVGFDTPETFRPKCQQELELGRAATARMAELVELAVGIEDSGKRDRYGRVLGSLILSNGKTAGHVLLEEGHAVVWEPGYRANWCS
ncbi:MAG: thermonuclease family protein [Pseudomonadota bacterium]|jgi:endonuclease YncB( thermonuclease family)|nr:thermonuclease family protein [Pseudomonadota bacterium]